MLRSLFVSELALIRRLSLDLDGGFTVLTGETGAGKSLVLDSLNLFLKTGSARDLVRRGAEEMTVDLYFDGISPEAKDVLRELDAPAEEDGAAALSRVVSAEGRSVMKLNGRGLPQSAVRRAAEALIAIHGQNDTGLLLDEKNHLACLDSALPAEGAALLARYGALWKRYRGAEDALAQWQAEPDPAVLADLYAFQIKEIARVKPRIGEEEELEEKRRFLAGAAAARDALRVADRALNGGEKGRGAAFLLNAAAGKLELLDEKDPLAEKARDLAAEAAALADEVSRRYADAVEEDPAEAMDRVQKRLDLLYRLKQKYGGTVEKALETYEKAVAGREKLALRESETKRLEEEKKALLSELRAVGAALRKARRAVGDELEKSVSDLLSFLDMPGTALRVAMEELPAPGPAGLDKVAFLLAANAGEGERPLSRIASGGELSRIMLALQLKLGKAKTADTVVFDEIDTGVSGATAQKIGLCLKALGRTRQVLCVTHSAQVASLSDHHLLVEKAEKNGRTETSVRRLTPEESLEEVARILGGRTLGRATRENAMELKAEGLREYDLQKGRLDE